MTDPTGPAPRRSRSTRPAGTSAQRDVGQGVPTAQADPPLTNAEIVSALAFADERDVETTLRPRRLADFIAQNRVREQLELLLQGAMRRGAPPEHILLSGAPGLGKTTLAMIIAGEL